LFPAMTISASTNLPTRPDRYARDACANSRDGRRYRRNGLSRRPLRRDWPDLEKIARLIPDDPDDRLKTHLADARHVLVRRLDLFSAEKWKNICEASGISAMKTTKAILQRLWIVIAGDAYAVRDQLRPLKQQRRADFAEPHGHGPFRTAFFLRFASPIAVMHATYALRAPAPARSSSCPILGAPRSRPRSPSVSDPRIRRTRRRSFQWGKSPTLPRRAPENLDDLFARELVLR
jgi:hypothetical protein